MGDSHAGYLSTGLHFPSPADNKESLEILHWRMKIRCESDSRQNCPLDAAKRITVPGGKTVEPETLGSNTDRPISVRLEELLNLSEPWFLRQENGAAHHHLGLS